MEDLIKTLIDLGMMLELKTIAHTKSITNVRIREVGKIVYREVFGVRAHCLTQLIELYNMWN